MFGIGEGEFAIILIFGFLLFGPDKLPAMGRTIGRVLRQFREASEGFTEVVQTNIVDPATAELNNSGSAKRTPKAARVDEDADLDEDAEEGATPKRETFAERKARLEAERAAREAEAAAAEAEASGDDADAPAEATQPTNETSKGEASPATAESSKKEPSSAKEDKGVNVRDLYQRSGSRHKEASQADTSAAGKGEDAEA